MKGGYFSSLAIVLWAFSSPCQAHTINLSPIVIIAKKPKPVISGETLSAQDIAKYQYNDLKDALNAQVGLFIAQQGSKGQTTQISIRGGNPEHTSVIVDGMKINDLSTPAGSCDLRAFGTEGMEKISITKGMSINDDNADALGGVVSMGTMQGSGPIQFDGNVEVGSFNTHREEIGLSGSNDNKIDYHLRLLNEGTKGTVTTPAALRTLARQNEPDSAQRIGFIGRNGVQLSENVRFNLWNRMQTANSHYINAYQTNPARINQLDTQYHRLEVDGKFTQMRSRLGYAFTQNKRHEKADFAPFDQEQTWISQTQTLSSKNEWQASAYYKMHLNLMAEQQAFKENSTNSAAVQKPGQFTYHNNTATLGNVIRPIKSWVIDVWARLHNHTQFKGRTTGQGSTRYTFDQTNTTLFARASTGIQAPSLYQVYDPTYGNKGLKPETSKGYDIGFQQDLWGQRLNFGSTYFNQTFDDLISGNYTTNWVYYNIAKAETYGVESFVGSNVTEDLHLQIEHTFLHAKDKQTNLQLKRRPMHKIAFKALFQATEALQLGAQLIVLGKQIDSPLNDSTERRSIKTPPVIRLWFDYILHSQKKTAVSVFGRIENTTNVRYEQPLGYNVPGFAVYAGVRMKLG